MTARGLTFGSDIRSRLMAGMLANTEAAIIEHAETDNQPEAASDPAV